MKRIASGLLMLALSLGLAAQPSNNYYAAAKGQKGYGLKTALFNAIAKHKDIGYDALWNAYKTTDLKADGTIYDCYSNTTRYRPNDHGASSTSEGGGFNREHSFPQSWFNKANPMKSDLFHVIPSDIYINNKRGNDPFGEVGKSFNASKNNYSKWGQAKSDLGYSGRVFEPNDEWKGDFARIYFYMATAYEDKIAGWSSPMLSGNRNSGYKEWAIKMLLRWSKLDPVSEKEKKRNNAVQKIQGNRNPYVDFPGLEEYIWGTKKELAFDPTNYQGASSGEQPQTPDTPDTPETPDTPDTPETPDTPDVPQPAEGTMTFVAVEKAADLQVGQTYLIVCESENVAMAAIAGNKNDVRGYERISITGNKIMTEVNAEGKPYTFKLQGSAGSYTLFDATSNSYLGYTAGSKNKLQSFEHQGAETKWNITFANDGTANISPQTDESRYVRYNKSSPRFACYIDNPSQFFVVKLYRAEAPSAIEHITASPNVEVYNLAGQRVRRNYPRTQLHQLPAGIYLINGQKVVVR